jgi:hypothetical protein
MRPIVFAVGLFSLALSLGERPVGACGNDLLVQGRCVRFQSDIPLQPASILVYKLNNPGLESILREAGHKLQSVENRQDLEGALKTGKYDIVLTVLSDASSLESVVTGAPSKPIILPVVLKSAKAEIATAERQYRYILKAPNRAGHYLATVDKAMDLKSKSDSKPKLVASK